MAKSSTIFGQRREFSVNAPAVGGGSSIPTVQFSAGNAQALQNFSRTLFGLSAQFQDQLDAEAEAEAAKAGAVAALQGNTEEQTYQTIRGRAYNKAMLDTFVTTMDTRAMMAVAELEQQYYNDPVRLKQALDDKIGGMADEINRIAPGSGAAFAGRNAARAQPAVEAARTTRFNLTRSEAEANLLLYEDAVTAQIKRNSVNLFSENPDESAAASAAVAQSVGEYLRTFDAIDPITNKPLYSPAEKAKAEVYMRKKIATDAAQGWFDAQPDKLEAYMQISEPDFQFKMNIAGQEPGKVVYANKGKKRSLPVKKEVMSKLKLAVGAMGPGIEAHITSGGQVTKEEARRGLGSRTGGPRHDHGGSADIVLSVKGKMVTPQQAPELYEKFLENAAAAGFTGIGHYSWGVHVGGGSVASWGPNESNGTLAPNFGKAIERGRSRLQGGPLTLTPSSQVSRPLREVLGEDGFANFDASLQRQIKFMDTQEDRRIRQEEKQVEAYQEENYTRVNARIYAEGQTDPATNAPIPAVSVTDLLKMVDEGEISDKQFTAAVKAATTEKPDVSDAETYQELQRRMWNSENIQEDILANVGKLSQGDADKLLNKNKELNGEGSAVFTPDESFYFSRLREFLGVDNFMEAMEDGKQARIFAALDEFKERIEARRTSPNPEPMRDIVSDLTSRVVIEDNVDTARLFENFITPRFAVASPIKEVKVTAEGRESSIDVSRQRWLDIPASKEALRNAIARNQITTDAARRERDLLQRWEALQLQYLREQELIQRNEAK